jgi:GT2 family glycosyltransferase
MIAISLLICTRDRASSLDRTLASVSRAAAETPVPVEVVVVDNGSSDDTAARLARWQERQCFPVRLVAEPLPGLARARNTGIAQARGGIIAMTDDDCVLDPGYFTLLAARFAQWPAPVVVGGRILLGDPADLPVTIKLEDHPMVAAPGSFPGGFVMGANLAFTRDVVERVGPFDTRFGAGARFAAAEDTDFLFRAMGCGIPVRYDPYVVVSHHHGRRSTTELTTLMAGYAFGDGALYAKHLLADGRIARALRKDVWDLAKDMAGGQRPFAAIRFFHAFRLRMIATGFVRYLISRGHGASRTDSISPDRVKHPAPAVPVRPRAERSR